MASSFGLIDAKIFGQQFPCKGDSVCFEIIPETEISEHFKERMVARCVADIVQIIVFAARAHTFLRARGTGVVAGLYTRETGF